jgi:hypothetical protein
MARLKNVPPPPEPVSTLQFGPPTTAPRPAVAKPVAAKPAATTRTTAPAAPQQADNTVDAIANSYKSGSGGEQNLFKKITGALLTGVGATPGAALFPIKRIRAEQQELGKAVLSMPLGLVKMVPGGVRDIVNLAQANPSFGAFTPRYGAAIPEGPTILPVAKAPSSKGPLGIPIQVNPEWMKKYPVIGEMGQGMLHTLSGENLGQYYTQIKNGEPISGHVLIDAMNATAFMAPIKSTLRRGAMKYKVPYDEAAVKLAVADDALRAAEEASQLLETMRYVGSDISALEKTVQAQLDAARAARGPAFEAERAAWAQYSPRKKLYENAVRAKKGIDQLGLLPFMPYIEGFKGISALRTGGFAFRTPYIEGFKFGFRDTPRTFLWVGEKGAARYFDAANKLEDQMLLDEKNGIPRNQDTIDQINKYRRLGAIKRYTAMNYEVKRHLRTVLRNASNQQQTQLRSLTDILKNPEFKDEFGILTPVEQEVIIGVINGRIQLVSALAEATGLPLDRVAFMGRVNAERPGRFLSGEAAQLGRDYIDGKLPAEANARITGAIESLMVKMQDVTQQAVEGYGRRTPVALEQLTPIPFPNILRQKLVAAGQMELVAVMDQLAENGVFDLDPGNPIRVQILQEIVNASPASVAMDPSIYPASMRENVEFYNRFRRYLERQTAKTYGGEPGPERPTARGPRPEEPPGAGMVPSEKAGYAGGTRLTQPDIEALEAEGVIEPGQFVPPSLQVEEIAIRRGNEFGRNTIAFLNRVRGSVRRLSEEIFVLQDKIDQAERRVIRLEFEIQTVRIQNELRNGASIDDLATEYQVSPDDIIAIRDADPLRSIEAAYAKALDEFEKSTGVYTEDDILEFELQLREAQEAANAKLRQLEEEMATAAEELDALDSDSIALEQELDNAGGQPDELLDAIEQDMIIDDVKNSAKAVAAEPAKPTAATIADYDLDVVGGDWRDLPEGFEFGNRYVGGSRNYLRLSKRPLRFKLPSINKQVTIWFGYNRVRGQKFLGGGPVPLDYEYLDNNQLGIDVSPDMSPLGILEQLDQLDAGINRISAKNTIATQSDNLANVSEGKAKPVTLTKEDIAAIKAQFKAQVAEARAFFTQRFDKGPVIRPTTWRQVYEQPMIAFGLTTSSPPMQQLVLPVKAGGMKFGVIKFKYDAEVGTIVIDNNFPNGMQYGILISDMKSVGEIILRIDKQIAHAIEFRQADPKLQPWLVDMMQLRDHIVANLSTQTRLTAAGAPDIQPTTKPYTSTQSAIPSEVLPEPTSKFTVPGEYISSRYENVPEVFFPFEYENSPFTLEVIESLADTPGGVVISTPDNSLNVRIWDEVPISEYKRAVDELEGFYQYDKPIKGLTYKELKSRGGAITYVPVAKKGGYVLEPVISSEAAPTAPEPVTVDGVTYAPEKLDEAIKNAEAEVKRLEKATKGTLKKPKAEAEAPAEPEVMTTEAKIEAVKAVVDDMISRGQLGKNANKTFEEALDDTVPAPNPKKAATARNSQIKTNDFFDVSEYKGVRYANTQYVIYQFDDVPYVVENNVLEPGRYKHTPNGPEKISDMPSRAGELIEKTKKEATKPVKPVQKYRTADGFVYLLEDADGNIYALEGKRFESFNDGSYELRASAPNKPIAVFKNKKIVGLVMPLRLENLGITGRLGKEEIFNVALSTFKRNESTVTNLARIEPTKISYQPGYKPTPGETKATPLSSELPAAKSRLERLKEAKAKSEAAVAEKPSAFPKYPKGTTDVRIGSGWIPGVTFVPPRTGKLPYGPVDMGDYLFTVETKAEFSQIFENGPVTVENFPPNLQDAVDRVKWEVTYYPMSPDFGPVLTRLGDNLELLEDAKPGSIDVDTIKAQIVEDINTLDRISRMDATQLEKDVQARIAVAVENMEIPAVDPTRPNVSALVEVDKKAKQIAESYKAGDTKAAVMSSKAEKPADAQKYLARYNRSLERLRKLEARYETEAQAGTARLSKLEENIAKKREGIAKQRLRLEKKQRLLAARQQQKALTEARLGREIVTQGEARAQVSSKVPGVLLPYEGPVPMRLTETQGLQPKARELAVYQDPAILEQGNVARLQRMEPALPLRVALEGRGEVYPGEQVFGPEWVRDADGQWHPQIGPAYLPTGYPQPLTGGMPRVIQEDGLTGFLKNTSEHYRTGDGQTIFNFPDLIRRITNEQYQLTINDGYHAMLGRFGKSPLEIIAQQLGGDMNAAESVVFQMYLDAYNRARAMPADDLLKYYDEALAKGMVQQPIEGGTGAYNLGVKNPEAAAKYMTDYLFGTALNEIMARFGMETANVYGSIDSAVSLASIGKDTKFLPVYVKQAIRKYEVVPEPPGGIKGYLIRGSARATRAFKTTTLMFSINWQLGDLITNMMLAHMTGVSVDEMMKAMSEVKAVEYGTGKGTVRRMVSPNAPELESYGPLGQFLREAPVQDISLAQEERAVLKGVISGKERGSRVARAVSRRTGYSPFKANESINRITRHAYFLVKFKRALEEAGFDMENKAAFNDMLATRSWRNDKTIRALVLDVAEQANDVLGDFMDLTYNERGYVLPQIPFYTWAKHIHKVMLLLGRDHPQSLRWYATLGALSFDPSDEQNQFTQFLLETPLGFSSLQTINPLADVAGGPIAAILAGRPREAFRVLGPGQKLAGAAVGLDVGRGFAAFSRPYGSTPVDEYGSPLPDMSLLARPEEFLGYAAQQFPIAQRLMEIVPAGAQIGPVEVPKTIPGTRIALGPTLRYSTGEARLSSLTGQRIEKPGGTLAALGRLVALPLVPSQSERQILERSLAAEQQKKTLQTARLQWQSTPAP